MKYQPLFSAQDSCRALRDSCMLTLVICALVIAKMYSPNPWRMIACYFETL